MKAPLLLGCLILTTISHAQLSDTISISGVAPENNISTRSSTTDKDLTQHRVRSIQFNATDTLSTPNPSREAVALYRYLQDMFGKQMLSGQMWTPWGINEIEYVSTKTGKIPAIAGFDYINEPQNAGENQKAIEYWHNGGIVTMMWHWGAPGVGEGYENSKATIDIDQCFVKATLEYEDFWADLERIGDWLQKLEDAQVPVLWRPFHELDGGWFWWSKEGPEKFKLLWKTMYNYLVHERGLNNLIWVLCYTGTPDGDWFPGAEYVDIAGADTYDNMTDSHVGMYYSVLESVDGQNYPVAFHETGIPPRAEECIEDGALWSWWMIWHTDWLEEIEEGYLKEEFNSHLVVTHDELPDILTTYGWEDDCLPTKTSSFVKVDDKEWQETNKMVLNSGTSAQIKVSTAEDGLWTWYGLDEVSRTYDESQQTIAMDKHKTVVATFENTCGALTTQSFHVVNGLPDQPVLSIEKPADIVAIYPSPTADFLNIKYAIEHRAFPVSIKITDLYGRPVLSKTQGSLIEQIDISGLSNGVYQITILSSSHIATKKFIKK